MPQLSLDESLGPLADQMGAFSEALLAYMRRVPRD